MAEIDDKLRINYIETLLSLTVALNAPIISHLLPTRDKHIALGLYLTTEECVDLAKITIFSWTQIRNHFLSKEEFNVWKRYLR